MTPLMALFLIVVVVVGFISLVVHYSRRAEGQRKQEVQAKIQANDFPIALR